MRCNTANKPTSGRETRGLAMSEFVEALVSAGILIVGGWVFLALASTVQTSLFNAESWGVLYIIAGVILAIIAVVAAFLSIASR